VTQANKAIVQQWIEEIWIRGNFERAVSLLHPELIDHMPAPGQAPGREGHLAKARAARAAFPDLQVTLEALIGEGDRVVDMWTFKATHSGTSFLGIAPSGKAVEFQGIDIVRLQSSMITEIWHIEDFSSALAQLTG
jgi:predicted ester cyclase